MPTKMIRIKTASGWQDIPLIGAQGNQGPQGFQGNQGPAGSAPMTPMPDDMKCSYKAPGTAYYETGAFSTAQEIYGNAVGDLRQYITPAVNVWWEVEYWTILRCVDASWQRIDYKVTNDIGGPADALGRVHGNNYIMPNHSALSWRTARFKALYKVSAGAAMAVRGVVSPQSGTWVGYCFNTYVGSSGKVVGYW